MKDSFDAAVIGAGIAGLATALHLQERGQQVLLIDRRGAGLETSYGNAGILGNTYVIPFVFPRFTKILQCLLDRDESLRVSPFELIKNLPWLYRFYLNSKNPHLQANGAALRALTYNSEAEHRYLMQGTPCFKHLHHGSRVSLYRTPKGFAADAGLHHLATEYGVPFEVVTPESFVEKEPFLIPAYFKAVVWPASASLDNPGRVLEGYAEKFKKRGGTFAIATVEYLNKDGLGRWRLHTQGKDFFATSTIVATGPWSSDFMRPMGYRFPMAYKRGYHQHFEVPQNTTLQHSIVDTEHGYVLSPMEQGYRLTTGVEFADRGAKETPLQLARCLSRARELFPLGEAIETKPWIGSRPCFPDSLPVVGPAPHHPGLWFNFGHSHYGLTMGPASGRLLAEMITNTPTFCDTLPYRAERFVKLESNNS